MKKIMLGFIIMFTMVYADFIRNNGIVTDYTTGLIWQDDYSDSDGNIKDANWTDAINYCENLSLGSYTDWRLPNKKELLSILDRSRYLPAIDAKFQKSVSDRYWSSTTQVYYRGDAWVVYFDFGSETTYLQKTYSCYVRCVRGGYDGQVNFNLIPLINYLLE